MRARALLAGVAAGLIASLAGGAAGAQNQPDAELLKRGEYLTIAGDCTACHTVDRNKPFAGGYPIQTPMGVIYAPNITPDRETGIGAWSDDEFVRALRQGIGKHGEHLYPAFPYDSYTLLSREDALAIKAHLFSLKPIRQATPANQLSFPFNQRWILWGWKLFNFREGRFQPDASRSADWNRGAYLVEALEHCGACHTPRNLTMGEDNAKKFGGGDVGSWHAYNITSDPASGVGAWSDGDLASYLSTGVAPGKASAADGMAEAVENSLRFLRRDDIQAIVTYLRGVPPIHDASDIKPRFQLGAPAVDEAALRGGTSITASNDAARGGAELFSGNCASCHGQDGNGAVDGTYPPLLHNSTVGASRPNNLVMVILDGVLRRGEHGTVLMPGFADHLSDRQVADLANYMFKQFGNPKVGITADQVGRFRRGGGNSLLTKLVPAAEIAAGLVVFAAIIGLVFLVGRSRRRFA